MYIFSKKVTTSAKVSTSYKKCDKKKYQDANGVTCTLMMNTTYCKTHEKLSTVHGQQKGK